MLLYIRNLCQKENNKVPTNMTYKQETKIAEGVTAEKNENEIVIKGSKGEIKRAFYHPHVKFSIDNNKIITETERANKKTRAIVGTWRSHISNMIKGISEGYEAKLSIVYAHFPMNVSVEGDRIQIKNYFGSKGIRYAKILGDTKVEIKKQDMTLSGTNKEDIGQTAANLEQSCKPKGKDRRVFQDGIYITKKP